MIILQTRNGMNSFCIEQSSQRESVSHDTILLFLWLVFFLNRLDSLLSKFFGSASFIFTCSCMPACTAFICGHASCSENATLTWLGFLLHKSTREFRRFFILRLLDGKPGMLPKKRTILI